MASTPWALRREALPFRLRLWLPSTTQAIHRATEQFRGLLERCGCSEDLQADVEIALVEALANAMEHGNGSQRKIFLRCYGGPDAGVLIAVRDQGRGFDPQTVPDPRKMERLQLRHGRGLFLIRSFMDQVAHNASGNQITMTKLCRDENGAEAC